MSASVRSSWTSWPLECRWYVLSNAAKKHLRPTKLTLHSLLSIDNALKIAVWFKSLWHTASELGSKKTIILHHTQQKNLVRNIRKAKLPRKVGGKSFTQVREKALYSENHVQKLHCTLRMWEHIHKRKSLVFFKVFSSLLTL